MALDEAFVADCPYGPGGLLIDEIVELDPEHHRVVALLHAHAELPLTREQRAHPIRHPRHVSGGLMVHLTGMVGFVHAYYVLGLKHAEGWVGYGGRIHSAKFLALADASPGALPLHLEGRATQVRKMAKSVFCRYEFSFRQGDTVVYTGDQSAMWVKPDGAV